METQNDIAVYTGVYIGMYISTRDLYTARLIFRLGKIGSKKLFFKKWKVYLLEKCVHIMYYKNIYEPRCSVDV